MQPPPRAGCLPFFSRRMKEEQGGGERGKRRERWRPHLAVPTLPICYQCSLFYFILYGQPPQRNATQRNATPAPSIHLPFYYSFASLQLLSYLPTYLPRYLPTRWQFTARKTHARTLARSLKARARLGGTGLFSLLSWASKQAVNDAHGRKENGDGRRSAPAATTICWFCCVVVGPMVSRQLLTLHATSLDRGRTKIRLGFCFYLSPCIMAKSVALYRDVSRLCPARSCGAAVCFFVFLPATSLHIFQPASGSLCCISCATKSSLYLLFFSLLIGWHLT